MVPSYDPELNLIYIGTSITSPAPKFLLGGADQKHLYPQLHTRTRCRHRRDPVVRRGNSYCSARSAARAAARMPTIE